VAWDPVLDGRAYLHTLEKDANSEGLTLEDRGLALTPEARAEFDAITPALYGRLRLPILVVVTQGAADGVEQALLPGREGDRRVDVEYVEGASPWMEGEFGPGGLPVQALRRIADWLG